MSKFTVEEIRVLSEIMLRNNLESIKVEDGDYSLKITAAAQRESCATHYLPAAVAAADVPESQALPGQLVTSPIVGVFYSASSPEAEPFVTVGSRVNTGDVLCIIEAMKLMNEITAEFDGEVVEVLAENGEVVDFGRPLFRIK